MNINDNIPARLILTMALVMTAAVSQAQTTIPKERKGSGSSVIYGNVERSGMMGTGRDVNSSPVGYGQFNDRQLKQIEAAMQERDWAHEDTAWQRACSMNTKDSYQRYIAIYPNGAHIAEANVRLIDLQVNDVFNKKHGSLPFLNRTERDDDSPTSTVMVDNETGYPLTVMYSGTDSKKIVINPGCRGTVTVQNGRYRIAASVPAVQIRPYAGSEALEGGTYQVTYVITQF